MRKLILAIIIFSVCLIGFSQYHESTDHLATEYYYPLRIQVRDTIGIEVAYIDFNNGKVIIRGNLETGLRKLSELIQGTFQAEAYAQQIRAQLYTSGRVKSQLQLAKAIREYDSIRAIYGK